MTDIGARGSVGNSGNSKGSKKEIGVLVVVVLKAQNLPDKHKFSKQDPYCTIELTHSGSASTKPEKNGGQTPVWDEQFDLTVYEVDGAKPKLLLRVFAKELKDDDLLGEAEIVITGEWPNNEFDEWVPIALNGRYRGEVYLEMTFYPPEPTAKGPPRPPTKNSSDSSSHSLTGKSTMTMTPPRDGRPLSHAGPLNIPSSSGQILRRPTKLDPASRLHRPPPTHHYSDSTSPQLLPGGPKIKLQSDAYRDTKPSQAGLLPFPGEPEPLALSFPDTVRPGAGGPGPIAFSGRTPRPASFSYSPSERPRIDDFQLQPHACPQSTIAQQRQQASFEAIPGSPVDAQSRMNGHNGAEHATHFESLPLPARPISLLPPPRTSSSARPVPTEQHPLQGQPAAYQRPTTWTDSSQSSSFSSPHNRAQPYSSSPASASYMTSHRQSVALLPAPGSPVTPPLAGSHHSTQNHMASNANHEHTAPPEQEPYVPYGVKIRQEAERRAAEAAKASRVNGTLLPHHSTPPPPPPRPAQTSSHVSYPNSIPGAWEHTSSAHIDKGKGRLDVSSPPPAPLGSQALRYGQPVPSSSSKDVPELQMHSPSQSRSFYAHASPDQAPSPKSAACDISATQAAYYAAIQQEREDAALAARMAEEEDENRRNMNASRLAMDRLSEQTARLLAEEDEATQRSNQERREREEEDERIARAIAAREEMAHASR